MPSLNVNYGDMPADAADFLRSVQHLEEVIAEVKSKMTTLSTHWQSNSAETAQQVMDRWNADVRAMRDTLEDFSSHVREAGLNYQELENAIQRGFSGL
jgi:WXG100 family type VII secretion target